MEKVTKFSKVYITENEVNKLCLIYNNRKKNLLLRSDFNLNNVNENECLEDFINTIVHYETNGVEFYDMIKKSLDATDSHNQGKLILG